jgi:hypothetical protein
LGPEPILAKPLVISYGISAFSSFNSSEAVMSESMGQQSAVGSIRAPVLATELPGSGDGSRKRDGELGSRALLGVSRACCGDDRWKFNSGGQAWASM